MQPFEPTPEWEGELEDVCLGQSRIAPVGGLAGRMGGSRFLAGAEMAAVSVLSPREVVLVWRELWAGRLDAPSLPWLLERQPGLPLRRSYRARGWRTRRTSKTRCTGR